MMKIFITHELPGEYEEKLKEKYGVKVWSGKDISREDLLKEVKGVDGIVSLLTEKIDGEVMEAAGSQLKVIANYAVGYDNIDVSEATRRGIVVTNTPGVLTEAVGEHVIALTLALLRRVCEGDRFIRAGKFKGWEPDLLVGSALRDRVMGIVGMGRIGTWTAMLAKALGMRVIYYSRKREEEAEKETGAEYREDLKMILKEADVVSLNVPLTEETRGMIGLQELEMMKKSAILINTARGAVVNELDLIEALKNKVIAGVGLDVFEDEENVNPEFFKLDNVVLTPHIASATEEARLMMARLVYEGVTGVLEGKKPENIVNEEVWEKRVK